MATYEEEEKKIEEKFKKQTNLSYIPIIAGAFSTIIPILLVVCSIGSAAKKNGQIYKSPVIEKAIATNEALSTLEESLGEITSKVKLNALQIDAKYNYSAGISSLEQTITETKKDSAKQMENIEVKKYFEKREEIINSCAIFSARQIKNMIYGIELTSGLLILSAGMSIANRRRYSRDMNALKKKYNPQK